VDCACAAEVLAALGDERPAEVPRELDVSLAGSEVLSRFELLPRLKLPWLFDAFAPVLLELVELDESLTSPDLSWCFWRRLC
jgi:hypothetical protein